MPHCLEMNINFMQLSAYITTENIMLQQTAIKTQTNVHSSCIPHKQLVTLPNILAQRNLYH